MKKTKLKGFTLIELLMVIAIIGILAGILIPTVGAVRKQANVAASKAQLSNYVNAIQMFKGEYKYFPFVTGGGDTTIDLQSDSAEFIETLSGRNPSTGSPIVRNGNRRSLSFYSFSESEFYVDPGSELVSQTELADRFYNKNIRIRIDGDGDGAIMPNVSGSEPSRPSDPLRTNVTAWVEFNDDPDYGEQPGYSLWD